MKALNARCSNRRLCSAREKAGTRLNEMRMLLAGDLLNQIISRRICGA